MSTLWTPSGEHPVGDRRSEQAASPPPSPETGRAPREAGDPGVGDAEAAAQLDALRQQLAATPPEVVIANHCYGLFELAAVYLSNDPPRLAEAQLAIDALAALVEGLGDRLGESGASLRQGLAQVRLAYVQLDAATKAAHPVADGDGASASEAG